MRKAYLILLFIVSYTINSNFTAQVTSVNSVQSLLSAKQSLQNGSNSATIELASGTYFLTQPLVFNESDGRSGTNYITYKAAAGAKPIISGGYLVNGTWQQVAGQNYYKVNIPNNSNTAGLEYMRNLYVNGKRARRARSSAKQIVGAHQDGNGNYDGITISKDEIPLFSQPQYVELQQLVRWKDHYYKVDAIQNGSLNYGVIIKNYDWADTQSFSFAPQYYDPALVHERGKLDEWYFENAIELLDEPGEWYYDVATRDLYYYPLNNEDINQAVVIMPRLNQLVDIKSSGVNSKVKNLRFEGITFAHTNWDFPSIEGFLTLQGTIITNGLNSLGADNGVVPRTKTHVDAAVQVDGGENIIFQKNTFIHIGNNGLNIHNNANNIDILRNTFKDISANGMRISNVFNQTIDPAQGEATVSNTLIKNNYIEQIGREFRGSIGIEYMYTDNIKVLHNEIRDVPYIGISGGIGWEGPWSDNSTTMTDAEISYNKIVGAMNVAKEGGSIYTNNRHNSSVSGQYGLIMRENYVDEVSYPFTTQENDRQAPIHNDEGSANIRIVKNVIKTVRNNFQWAHKVCQIDIDSNYVDAGKTTNIIGNPRRCTTNVIITNTIYLPNSDAEEIKKNAGIEDGQEPPSYLKYTDNLAFNKPTFSSSYYNNFNSTQSSNAVDNNINSVWRRDDSDALPWWYVDLEDHYTIREVLVVDRHDADTPATRKNFIVELSDDDQFTNPVILHEQLSEPFPNKGTLKIYTDLTQKYRYVRLRKTVSNENFSLAEIIVYGKENNLALHKTATQSTTAWNGIADRAVDGNRDGVWNNGSVTHTEGTATNEYHWWQVDLGQVADIDEIIVFNREEYSDRLNQSYILISDTPFTSNDLPLTLLQSNVTSIYIETANSANSFKTAGLTGRYIRIQKENLASSPLSIAEVEVLGEFQSTIGSDIGADNLALSKTTTQSSTDHNGVSDRAVDGNTSGVWSNSSVTHTKGSSVNDYHWLEVDLGRIADIYQIRVYNRTTQMYRLNNTYILVSDTPFNSNNVNDALNQSGVSSYLIGTAGLVNSFTTNGITGRYVRIQKSTIASSPLSVAEVQVYGKFQEDIILNGTNLALNQTSSQSSTIANGVSSRAVDGNTDGIWTNNSVTHTEGVGTNDYHWWEVDLGQLANIDHIRISNRAEFGERLDNVYVFVSDVPFTSTNPNALASLSSVQNLYLQDAKQTNDFSLANISGRYIRVQKKDIASTPLSLAEVQVFGDWQSQSSSKASNSKKQKIEVDAKFQMYPNPVSDQLNFVLQNQVQAVRVFNMLGKELIFVSPQGNNSLKSINTRGLSKGVYFLKLQDNKGNIYSSKFIKQ